jgi:hypothetical protein
MDRSTTALSSWESVEFQQALRFVEDWNPLSIKPDAQLIDQFEHANFDTPPSPAMANEMAWDSAVGAAFYAHLSSIGIDGSRVSLDMPTKCDFDK